MDKFVFPSIRLQAVCFIALTALLLLQIYVIHPIEHLLLPHKDLDHASLMYLPHGLKVLLAFVMGISIFPAVLVAQLVGFYVFFGASLNDTVIGALYGSLAVFLPVILVNFMLARKWHQPASTSTNPMSLFRLFIVVVILSLFLNAALHGDYFANKGTISLPFRYMFGDMMGSLIVFGTAMIFRHQIARYVIRKHS